MDQIEPVTTNLKGDNIMTDQKRTNKAFTLIEVLISLVIIAMLMTAISTAINAAVINHTVNEDTFKAMNAARQTLLRITTELRTANEVFTDGGTVQQGLGFDDDNDAVSDRFHTYHYNKPGDALHDDTLEDNALYLITHIAGTDTYYMLCENVTDMTFTRTPATDPVKNVLISMTVMSGNIEKTVSTAAVIRRNME
jgi:prepilin-type N-terminal cleavage/methylation domain-containing protein